MLRSRLFRKPQKTPSIYLPYTYRHLTMANTSVVRPALPPYTSASLNHTGSHPLQGFSTCYHFPRFHMAVSPSSGADPDVTSIEKPSLNNLTLKESLTLTLLLFLRSIYNYLTYFIWFICLPYAFPLD